MTQLPSFSVISGPVISGIIARDRPKIREIVEHAYRLHAAGLASVPQSTFLRPPDMPSNRIIALPACIRGTYEVAGIKWIASFPENLLRGQNRASAIIILNDLSSGYPFAVLEGSVISAARTAASAALAAGWLSSGTRETDVLGIIGCGVIADTVIEFLCADGWHIGTLELFDVSRIRAQAFAERHSGRFSRVMIADSAREVVKNSKLLVLATTATEPWLMDAGDFRHNPIVLHLSLRDISPGVIIESSNVVDDIDHCLRANTSLHLTECATGSRAFVSGTLVDIMNGVCEVPVDRCKIFSPFGLGVLDVAVAKYVYDEARAASATTNIADFFSLQSS
jgi:2,3-diaminopropionate biosynthesis protein SbnB